MTSPGDLPDPGIKPGPPVLQADSLPPEPSEKHVTLGGVYHPALSLGSVAKDQPPFLQSLPLSPLEPALQ